MSKGATGYRPLEGVCVEEGCSNICYKNKGGARGYCPSCYQRNLRKGKIERVHGKNLEFMYDLVERCRKTHIEECVDFIGAKTSAGYGNIYYEGKNWPAHRLSLFLFTGENPEGKDCCHGPCHNRLCVNPYHLSWCSRLENCLDKKRDGTLLFGEKIANSKLTETRVFEIKERLIQGESFSKLSKDFGINKEVIRLICNDLIWASVDWPIKDYKSFLKDPITRSPPLSKEVVIEIKKMIELGFKNCQISKKFGLKRGVVSDIKAGKTYKDI